jgi:hypothetical protein
MRSSSNGEWDEGPTVPDLENVVPIKGGWWTAPYTRLPRLERTPWERIRAKLSYLPAWIAAFFQWLARSFLALSDWTAP